MSNPDLTLNEDMLPYDNPSQFPRYWGRVWATMSFCLAHPIAASRLIAYMDSKNDSFSFLLGILWPVQGISMIIQYVIYAVPWLHTHFATRMSLSGVSLTGTIFSIALFPVQIWIGLWVCAAINHGSLWAWRGLSHHMGITQTARAVGFSIAILFLVTLPVEIFVFFCPVPSMVRYAPWAFLLLGAVVFGLALSQVHCIQVWRGIAASLTPPILVHTFFVIYAHQPIFKFLY